MNEKERSKLIELTERAAVINEKLLSDEKVFIEAVAADNDPSSLQEMNEKLNDLCTKEHLYLSATKSLLQMMNKK